MQRDDEHHVARIDDTVTAANVHERAEAVAVPDFDYLTSTINALASAMTPHRHPKAPTIKEDTPK